MKGIYISNIFRLRFWQFTLLGGGILGGIVSVILGGGTFAGFVGIVIVCGVAWYMLHLQMACRSCGRILAVTRVAGQPEVCSHCKTPTDNALAQMQKQE